MHAGSADAGWLAPASGGVGLHLAAIAVAIFITIAIAIMGFLGVELGKYAADDGHVGGDETAKRLLHPAGADAVGLHGIDDAFDLGADERCVGEAPARRSERKSGGEGQGVYVR